MRARAVVRSITPLLIGGWCGKARCDGSDEGLRPSSVRGVAREFFRNVAYRMIPERKWEQVYRLESRLFGSTEQASPFIVRIRPNGIVYDVRPWCTAAGRVYKGNNRISRMFYPLRQMDNVSCYRDFTIDVLPRRSILNRLSSREEDQESLLRTFVLSITTSLAILGVGKRRSRGMGKLLPIEVEVNGENLLKDAVDLQKALWCRKSDEDGWAPFKNSVKSLGGAEPDHPRGLCVDYVKSLELCPLNNFLTEIRRVVKACRDKVFVTVSVEDYLLRNDYQVPCTNLTRKSYLIGRLQGFYLFVKDRKVMERDRAVKKVVKTT